MAASSRKNALDRAIEKLEADRAGIDAMITKLRAIREATPKRAPSKKKKTAERSFGVVGEVAGDR